MLSVPSSRRYRDCEGNSRRDFLKVGAIGMGALTLPNLLRLKAEARARGESVKDKSVIWVWLSGGPTHVETFDPKMTAPVEYRSVTGEVATKIPGVTLGGTFPQMAAVADKMAFVRSFAHTTSSHGAGTEWIMTGHYNRQSNRNANQARPSIGSIVSRVRGTNHPETGMPTYLRMGNIRGDGPAFLGTAFSPFDPSGQARKNMAVSIPEDRIGDRRNLLTNLDTIRRDVDASGLMNGLDGFEQQAFNLVLGKSAEAFDVVGEDPKTIKRYGNGLGSSLLKARRLCEAGCGFVNVSYGSWDMHGQIERSMKSRGPVVDQAVSALVEDLAQRGMSDDVLVVVTGEFGRTPKINKNAGRDHWGRLCTLALSGGGLQMGQVVGESAPKVDVPATDAISPGDLMATIFHVFGINPKIQFLDNFGRPRYMIEEGKAISELV
ncbi:MAG: DUF1501 domain-containing protein [Pirellulaceae bacterium]